MEQVQSVYEDFIGRYQISKTLRFKLNPVGKTQEWIDKNNIVDHDEQKMKDSKRVKEIIDDIHRKFIEDVLTSVKIDGWNELKEAILNKDKVLIKNLSENQRKQIVECFKKDDRYELLVNKKSNCIKKYLHEWMKDNNYRDEEIDLVKNFSKFTSYFDKYFESRKNMYSDKAQGTAIANRAINENFVRFINNIVKIQDLEKCGYNLMSKNDEYFDASNYNNYLSQKGIERYNKYIGNINSELNEAYQNKSISKKIKLLVLHKQILSDAEPLFRIEKFENDGEISKGIIDFFDPWLNTNVDKSTPEDKKPLNETINFLDNISDFDKSEIKINTKNISVLSKCLPDRIGRTEIIEILNLEEKKKSEDLLLSDIVEKINLAYEDKLIDFESVINRAKNLLTDYKNSIFDLYQSIRNTLDCNKTSEDKSILGNDDIIAGIKNLFDEVKRAESFRDLFGDRNDIDSSDFQQKYNDCNIGYKEFDKLYNLVRNYLTQKPYNTEKFKLTFNYPTLCNGWDFNKEDDNKSIILFKNSKYYLGILNGFVDSEYYSSNEVSDDTHYYKKLKFKTAGGASKQIPRIAFSEKWSNKSSNEQMQIIKKKKPSERTDRERIELIKFYQNFLKEYDWNNWFNFEFKNPSEYVSMEEFNEDVDSQAYLMDYQYISDKYIYEAVENGSLYLFEIYNKDFSEYSTGKKNLHTYYWELLFSSNNKENGYTFELNGGAELFYRPKSLEKKITHQKNEKIINKTYLKNGNMVSIPDDIYCELVEFLKENSEDETRKCAKKKLNLVDEEIEIRHTPHDIIKDKRYTQDQFNFHVPITINRTAPDTKKVSKTINNDICKLIKESKIKHIIGIDRGERNLIYASVIDMNGKLIEQKNFNIVNGADYHTKLDNKEKLRKSERKNWKSITQIKDLKSGYLSQVVREISDLIIKYDAILVMENLNYGFKSSVRAKFEKNIYHQFEKALIDKLSYLSKKPNSDDELWQSGGIAKGYQLVPYIDSLKDLTGQKGCVFYVNPWNTSHIDPTTGFMNLFKFPKNNVQFWKEFFNCMDSIKYDTENSYFVFAFKYSKFKNLVRCKDFIDRWKVCSYGERLYNKKSGKNWITEKIDPTEEIARLLNDSKIYFEDGHELKDEIVEKMTKIKSFGWLFRQIINLRNSRINSDEDFILSPVKNSDNKFFDSRYASQLQPCDADANGSYHIALKGLQITEENIICETDTTYKLESPKKPNEEWAKWIQEFHQR